jgi:hypothetical protein
VLARTGQRVPSAIAPAPGLAIAPFSGMTNYFRASAWTARLLGLVACLGLLAVPARASILDLTWDANTEAAVTGYLLSYGTVSGTYTTTVDVGNTTSWSSTTLTDGQPYFFAVQAYTAAGTRSPRSGELAVTPAAPSALTAPLPGAALSWPATFQWSAGSGVARHWLSIGTTPGGTELYDQNADGRTVTVASLPATSAPVYYVRLWSKIGIGWYADDYTYTATRPTLNIAGVSVLEGTSGSALASFAVTLTATAAAPVTVHYTTVNGTATAGTDVTAATGTLTIPAGVSTGIIQVAILGDTTPEADETFGVTLSTVSANAVLGTAQATGTIRNDDGAPALAQLTYPAAGAVNADLTQAVRWTPVANVQAYYLYIGSTLGANDLVNTGELQQTAYLASGLPGGQTLFARVWTKAGGTWRSTDSQFTAIAAAPVVAVLTTPLNGATAVDATRPMQWTAVAGAQAYYLYVGSTVGAKNLVDTGEIQTTASTAATLPAGQTVFARLWTKVGGTWRSIDSTFTVR